MSNKTNKNMNMMDTLNKVTLTAADVLKGNVDRNDFSAYDTEEKLLVSPLACVGSITLSPVRHDRIEVTATARALYIGAGDSVKEEVRAVLAKHAEKVERKEKWCMKNVYHFSTVDNMLYALLEMKRGTEWTVTEEKATVTEKASKPRAKKESKPRTKKESEVKTA